VAYIESALAAGLNIDQFAPRLSFFFNAQNDFLEEVAKFRAARRLYARLLRDRFGARDPRSMMLRFHTQTSGVSLTAQQPDNNLVRVTIQALAAVLGGTQSLHANSRDEALALPTEDSARLALRTQQIIAHESGVTETADPLGGSRVIEERTDAIERAAREYLDRIQAMGGTLRAIDQGFIQGEIQNAAYQHQLSVERGESVVVGVNRFEMEEEGGISTFRLDPAAERAQVERLRELRGSRGAGVRERLAALEQAARGTDNLMPHIVDAAAARATLGEISDCLRSVFGEYREAA
jgi:methylmalonyl-CoA mutase N-terminal domain/subunit